MITETSVSDKRTIERYIDLLVDAFGIPDEPPEAVLRAHFDTRNFSKCVQYIRNSMKVFFHLNVKSFNDSAYADEGSIARIHLPKNLHLIEKQFQVNCQIRLDIKESRVMHFPLFVQAISHEVAHLVLLASDHQLKHSEVATDLCVLVFGFGEIIRPGRSFLSKKGIRAGYLTDEQFLHAMWYLQKIRTLRADKPLTIPVPTKSWWTKLIDWFMN